MNFLNVFEDRVSGIFGTTSAPMPFSFKKMAKRAAHEMENETYVINGVDTAPALYTILISQEDDTLMQPVYGEVTRETAQFLEAQAQRRGYAFIGQPLVRFMVDPSLKAGRFSAFAENVDARTLERLRDEENRFMQSRLGGGLGGAATPAPAPKAAHARVPETRRAPSPGHAPIRMTADSPGADALDGLDVMPDDDFGAGDAPAEPAPTPVSANPRLSKVPEVGSSAELYGAGAGIGHEQAAKRSPAPVPTADPADFAPQAMLIDRQSGRTYVVKGERAIIGRERTSGGLILRDPNVSRRHAELDFDGARWVITDLNSTNGTLVNDVDVDECTLHDGDVITLGLTNLEFREN